jgi:hypothetical protein
MPLARIDLREGQSAEYRQTIGEVVYAAMIETLGVPDGDRFQVISEHPAQNFIFDPDYLGIHRSQDCVFIQLTLLAGRTVGQKSAFTNPSRTDYTSICTCVERTYLSIWWKSAKRTGPSAMVKPNTRNSDSTRRGELAKQALTSPTAVRLCGDRTTPVTLLCAQRGSPNSRYRPEGRGVHADICLLGQKGTDQR